MPKYRIIEKSFIDNAVREEGTVMDLDIDPKDAGANLECLDAPKAKAKGKEKAPVAVDAIEAEEFVEDPAGDIV